MQALVKLLTPSKSLLGSAFTGSGRHDEASWKGLGSSWRELEQVSWKAAGGLLEASWRQLEGSGRHLEAKGQWQ